MNNLRSNSKLKAGQTLQVANNASRSIADNSSITYKVRKGDSLASIAKRHGVNINDVMRWNSVITKASQIQPGDMLTLYVRDSANSNT